MRTQRLAGGTKIEQKTRASKSFQEAARLLAQTGRAFYDRGWVLGTSGNFSAVVSRSPLRLAITPSGVEKGAIHPDKILEVDASGKCAAGGRRSSAETELHMTVVRARDAGAVLHTHSIWSTLLSIEHAADGGFAIEGYEMLKGLAGVHTHEHREWLPIIQNSQDMAVLSREARRVLQRFPEAHGFLIRGHGLYTWGKDMTEARRHVEIIEFLLEVVGRRLFRQTGAAASPRTTGLKRRAARG